MIGSKKKPTGKRPVGVKANSQIGQISLLESGKLIHKNTTQKPMTDYLRQTTQIIDVCCNNQFPEL
ncbi:hypothetical protein EZMO1_2495 [Endozoicomonas montiporae CL-33]|uniref:Uncharacterized protein n=1 Tax=Endozoicomonas montiporae CL-33 TaxID=570277 RepID=A0A142BCV1_9GAMM|nr:hypothetical protein EZMO1_2495 [Endozoicomonas montiporae CL-33]